MIALSHKSKQYGLLALKVLILTVTFGYIYMKVKGQEGISFTEFTTAIQYGNWDLYLIFVGLACINWIFEIAKWRHLASLVKRVSFREAARQSLAALTVSLATPGRIGDYGAKAYFFYSEQRKRVLLLNLFSNGVQMGITCIFGVFGLAYTAEKFGWTISNQYVAIGILLLVLLGIAASVFKERTLLIKGLSLTNVIRYFSGLPISVKWNTVIYSLFRYMAFSVLFFLLLNFYGAALTFWSAMPLIFAMYLFVSVMPTLFIFDVVVRGGVAIWLFGLADIPEWPVLYTVFTMWLLNFVFPALWGSYYVITHRKK